MSRDALGRLRPSSPAMARHERAHAQVMLNSVLRIMVIAATATWASVRLEAAPLAAPGAVHPQWPTAIERTQYMHLGKPYCWYLYGWAGPGWYWCGHGTRAGIGWGGGYGWNGWVVPRTYRGLPAVPGYRFRHYD
jgi:hypothetical protein